MSETNSVGWTPASVLVNATGDAMDNIFDIVVEWPTGLSDETLDAAVSYRADGVDIPEPKTKTYEVTWHGVRVRKVAAGIDLDRTLKINYRLDANYKLYSMFTAWKCTVTDVNTSGVANTESALGKLKVMAPGAEYSSLNWSSDRSTDSANLLTGDALDKDTYGGSDPNLTWVFEDVQVVNVGTPKFKNQAQGSKMTYTVEFTFGDAYYPFSNTVTGATHSHKE